MPASRIGCALSLRSSRGVCVCNDISEKRTCHPCFLFFFLLLSSPCRSLFAAFISNGSLIQALAARWIIIEGCRVRARIISKFMEYYSTLLDFIADYSFINELMNIRVPCESLIGCLHWKMISRGLIRGEFPRQCVLCFASILIVIMKHILTNRHAGWSANHS